MDVNNKKLRDGIISKLKDYDAYIDNELPDYIIVMLANKKTILQIKNDLQLFLGANTDQFSDWLQKVMSNPELLDNQEKGERIDKEKKNEDALDKENVDSKPRVITLPGTKDKKSTSEFIELHIQESQVDSLMSHDSLEGEAPKPHSDARKTDRLGNDREGQRSRLPSRKKTRSVQPDSTKDQDLRAFIAQRREERHKLGRSGHYDNESESSEEEKEQVSTSLSSSVVKIMKRPQLREKGGGRLLQKALLGLGAKRKSSTRDNEGKGSKVKVRQEERGVVKRVLRVNKDDLNKIFSTKKSAIASVSQVSSTESQGEGRDQEGKETGSGEASESSEAGDQVVIELERDEEQDLQDQIIEKATIAAVKSVLPMAARLGRKRQSSEPSDLRDLITSKARRTDSPSTRFVLTLDGADDSHLEGPQEELTAGNSVPERCRFWPNCKNGDSCSYVHPTVPCRLFPNCKYGNRCLYVHPQCKFDLRCTRPDCLYLHTAPRHLKPAVVPMPPQVPMFKPNFGQIYSPGGQRFPKKSALTWTANKSSHISERKFAVPDDKTSSLPL